MSRTHKDAPAARRTRLDRRFAAERELPLPARRLEAVPADPWDSFADPGLSAASRLAAAAWLGMDGTPTDVQLLAAPCPHRDAHGRPVSCSESEVLVRAELTDFANSGW